MEPTAYKKGQFPLLLAACVLPLVGWLSYQFNIVDMVSRNSLAILASVLSTFIYTPPIYGTYVDPSVLNACPGYVVQDVASYRGGGELQIDLTLPKGAIGCGVFGKDIERLTLVATYETGM